MKSAQIQLYETCPALPLFVIPATDEYSVETVTAALEARGGPHRRMRVWQRAVEVAIKLFVLIGEVQNWIRADSTVQ